MTPEQKRQFAELYIECYNSSQTNPRFPRSIYAILDDNGEIEDMQTIPAVHHNSLNDNEVVLLTVQDPNIGEWEFNEDGTLVETETLVDDMLDCLIEWDTIMAVEDALDAASDDYK